MQPLDVPASPDKFRGEPIEQFGMRGPIALNAEVIDRLEQADTKKGLPLAIDGDACRKRIGWIDKPFRQS